MSWSALCKEFSKKTRFQPKSFSLKHFQVALKALSFQTWPFWKKKFIQNPRSVILIGGTNGKGTTSCFLESLLIQAQKKVGTFLSPHLTSLEQRFRYQGGVVSKDLVVSGWSFLKKKTDLSSLTFFETLTLLGVFLFTSDKLLPCVDSLLLEVGMGGEKDATNAVPHGSVILTSLSYDHTQYLGTQLTQIANTKFKLVHTMLDLFEKHPLLKTHTPLLTVHPSWKKKASFLFQALVSHQIEIKKPLPFQTRTKKAMIPKTIFSFQKNHLSYQTELSFLGNRAAQNAALALSSFFALEKCFFPLFRRFPNGFLKALKNTHLPGRGDLWIEKKTKKRILFSGDHNVEGIQSLLEILQSFSYERIFFLFGTGKNKDSKTMLALLKTMAPTLCVLTQGPQGKDLSPLQEERFFWEPHALQAFQKIVSHLKKKDLLVVTGSLYLVGALEKHLKKDLFFKSPFLDAFFS